MTVRHRLRRLLRMLARFLDPLSAAAIRPPAPTAAIAEVEAALQVERAVKFGQGGMRCVYSAGAAAAAWFPSPCLGNHSHATGSRAAALCPCPRVAASPAQPLPPR